MNMMLALLAAVTLATQWKDIPDTNTVGSVLDLGNGPTAVTNAANGAIAKYDETNLTARINAKYAKPNGGIPMSDLASALQTTIYGKQDALVSGSNIKTINNQSILGAGNIVIEGGGGGGTSNYNLLNNKPIVGGKTVEGSHNVSYYGGVTAQSATNITDAIIASSNLCTVAAAQAMSANAVRTNAQGVATFYKWDIRKPSTGTLVATIGPNSDRMYDGIWFERQGVSPLMFSPDDIYYDGWCIEGISSWSFVYNTAGSSLQDALDTKADAYDVYTKNQVYTKTEINNTFVKGMSPAWTNGVAAVVTNDVSDSTPWTTGNVYEDASRGHRLTNTGIRYSNGYWQMHLVGTYYDTPVDEWGRVSDENGQSTNPNATYLKETIVFGTNLTSTRSIGTPHNALGLAYEKDLVSASSVTGIVKDISIEKTHGDSFAGWDASDDSFVLGKRSTPRLKISDSGAIHHVDYIGFSFITDCYGHTVQQSLDQKIPYSESTNLVTNIVTKSYIASVGDFRTKQDNICHISSGYLFSVTSAPANVVFIGQPTHDAGAALWTWESNVGQWLDDSIAHGFDPDTMSLTLHNQIAGSTVYAYAKRDICATAGRPFVTDDNVPSLSGKTYDFHNGTNFTKNLYTALTNVIQTLGGTVTNPPTFD